MWSMIERGKKIIFAMVLSIIPMVLLYVQSKDEDLRQIISWPMAQMAGGIERGVVAITGRISDALFRYFFMAGRANELIDLRAQVLTTEALRARLLDLINERSSLLELRDNYHDLVSDLKIARVVARAGAPMARMIRIDLGSVHGIAPKSPVIAHEGIVGQVLTAAPNFSDVLLISDASFAIDARIVESGARGLLRGKTTPREYAMEFCDMDGLVRVSLGDRVVTTGENSHFPAGIPIGIITDVVKDRRALSSTAKVKPFVNIDDLTFVMVPISGGDEFTAMDSSIAFWPMAAR